MLTVQRPSPLELMLHSIVTLQVWTTCHLVYVFITCVSKFSDPGEDYQAVSRRRLTFSANDRERQKCFNGIIYNRATVENTEQFSVNLTRPAGLSDRIKIIKDHGYVTIVDDDGECYIISMIIISTHNSCSISGFCGYAASKLLSP